MGACIGICDGCYSNRHTYNATDNEYAMKKMLSKNGREDVALALILLKDFKCQGKMDVDVTMQVHRLAEFLGVEAEMNALIPKIPPLKIEERYP